jgi:carotenoid cleavage dioxygenase-like enzyme
MVTTTVRVTTPACQEERVSEVTTLTDVDPWRQGSIAPARQERDDSDFEVTGSIPLELNGLVLRTGGEFRLSFWRRP